MTPHDWARIVAHAQDAAWARRWARFQVEHDDVTSALSLEAQADRAEQRVIALARAAGVPLAAVHTVAITTQAAELRDPLGRVIDSVRHSVADTDPDGFELDRMALEADCRRLNAALMHARHA